MIIFRTILLYTLVLCFSLLTSSCGSPDYEELVKKRYHYLQSNSDEILIVAFNDDKHKNYLRGVQLAIKEINDSKDQLLGKKIKLQIEQEGSTFEETKATIRRVASNPKVVAVVGHSSSEISIPASIIYDESDIIFLSSFATMKSLTQHNFNSVFRMQPNNQRQASQIASVTKILNHKKIISIYSRDDYSTELAFLFEAAAVEKGIKIEHRASFFNKDKNYRFLISKFNHKEFSAIFLSSQKNSTIRMVKQLRGMGVNVPIFTTDSLTADLLSSTNINSKYPIIIPTTYNTESNNKINKDFISKYQHIFKSLPDVNAAQGYDSIMLLSHAIVTTKSILPTAIITALQHMPMWLGVTGLHKFDRYGEIQGKKYYFNALLNNKIKRIKYIEKFYSLDLFDKQFPKKNTKPFKEIFSEKMPEYSYKKSLLDFSYRILDFKKIGIVYEHEESMNEYSIYSIIHELANERDFEIESCELNLSYLDEISIKNSVLDCFGKLVLSMDALLIPAYPTVDGKFNFARDILNSLSFFKIPIIYLGKGDNSDSFLTLSLESSLVDFKKPELSSLYSRLVNDMEVYDLERKISQIPTISINMKHLENNKRAENTLLTLSPDNVFNN